MEPGWRGGHRVEAKLLLLEHSGRHMHAFKSYVGLKLRGHNEQGCRVYLYIELGGSSGSIHDDSASHRQLHLPTSRGVPLVVTPTSSIVP